MALPPENEAKNTPQRKRWLSLLSVAAWTILLLFVIGLLLPVFFTTSGSRPPPKQVMEMERFATALEMFKQENGSYPTGTNGLNDLAVKPTSASTNWLQYLEKVPLDPWGHPYRYVFPGQHNTNSYDLSSAGPDGIPGTQDDIVNW